MFRNMRHFMLSIKPISRSYVNLLKCNSKVHTMTTMYLPITPLGFYDANGALGTKFKLLPPDQKLYDQEWVKTFPEYVQIHTEPTEHIELSANIEEYLSMFDEVIVNSSIFVQMVLSLQSPISLKMWKHLSCPFIFVFVRNKDNLVIHIGDNLFLGLTREGAVIGTCDQFAAHFSMIADDLSTSQDTTVVAINNREIQKAFLPYSSTAWRMENYA